MPLTVTILTPDKAMPPQQADHVTIPGAEGEAGIRVGHAPYVSLLKNGKVVHLKNISHYPMFEDPQLIANLVTDFCRKHGIVK